MARLKVKQISDFTSAVASLLASDLSGLAAVDSAQSVLIANNASGIAANDGDITTLQGVDSAQSVLIASNASAIASNDGDITDLASVDSAQSVLIASNASGIAANDGDITALQGVDSAQSVLIASNATAIGDNVKDITSLQGVDSAQSVLISDNATAITAILNGADADLDQFAEVVAYVNSVSSTGDLDLTNFMATSNANDSTHSTAILGLQGVDSAQSVLIAGNAGDISDVAGDLVDAIKLIESNDSDITALQGVDSAQSVLIAGNASAIAANDGDISALVNSVDSLESIDSLLSAEIAALSDTVDDAVADANEYHHQMWDAATLLVEDSVNGTSTFRLPFAIEIAANDDVLVFVNGHNIHPEFTFTPEGEEAFAEGWSSVDGQSFKLKNIGYILEATDHVYVVGKKA